MGQIETGQVTDGEAQGKWERMQRCEFEDMERVDLA
jgi:hypothetical protein